jgi:hypothetical protein
MSRSLLQTATDGAIPVGRALHRKATPWRTVAEHTVVLRKPDKCALLRAGGSLVYRSPRTLGA